MKNLNRVFRTNIRNDNSAATVTLVEDGMTKKELCSRCGKVLRSSMYGEWHFSGVVSNYCQHCGANLQKATK